MSTRNIISATGFLLLVAGCGILEPEPSLEIHVLYNDPVVYFYADPEPDSPVDWLMIVGNDTIAHGHNDPPSANALIILDDSVVDYIAWTKHDKKQVRWPRS